MENKFILDKASFRQRVVQLSNLPTLPNLLKKFNKMMSNPKVSMEAFGKELGKDQALTSKLLKLVNSSFYGFPGRISTITHALVLLGNDALKGLILTSNIFENLSPEAYPLWRHAIAVSLASRAIARELSLPDIEEFAVAGLLHDIGKVILHLEAPEEYRTVVNHSLTTELPIWKVETEMLGFDHATIGLWICEDWTLTAKLAFPIGYHHKPGQAKEHTIRVAVVALSDILVRGMGGGAESDLPIEATDPVLEEQVPLTLEQLHKLAEEIEPEIDNLQDLIPKDMK
jgi:putative nucleotidyltransferase with HDIG domain